MTNRIRSAFRSVLRLNSLEGRDMPATGLTVWSPLADNPNSWAQAAAVWSPKSLSVVAGSEADDPRFFLPMKLDEASARVAFADVPLLGSNTTGEIIALPDPQGVLQRFRVWEIETMAPELAAKYPDITTYRGQGIDDPAAILAADFTYSGFHAQVFSSTAYTITPVQTVSTGDYRAFYATDDTTHGPGCSCPQCLGAAEDDIGTTTETPSGDGEGSGTANLTLGTNLRTLRLAVAAAGEYSANAGGTVPLTLSAITTVINSVNAIYERDHGIHMNLVANNDQIIYTDASTDPYTGTSVSSMLSQNQTNLDTVILSSNYDIGHVFGGLNQGGIASLGVVGKTSKARGVSTNSGGQVTGNWMTFVTSHEMGHQYSAGHAFNGVSTTLTSNRMGGSAWEPGSGDSIMSYPHVSESGQAYSSYFQTYFHGGSIEQIYNYMNTIPTVGVTTPTGNSTPVVNAGVDRTIPANTPFTLTMTATDPNGDTLLLNWDEIDLGPALSLGAADNGTSPLFRSYFPTTGNFTRTLPNQTSLLANTTYAPETMPSTNRSLNFRAVARDNKLGGGAVTTDDVKYTVVNTGSAFAVTSPNTAVTIDGNSKQTITWAVAGTTGNGINASTVKISLSTDGGLTFPTVLAAGTPNDGSELLTIPNVGTSSARIKIEAVGNVFFDVSNVNFTINEAGTTYVVTNTNDSGSGSLRAAITAANATSVADFITFDPTFFSTAKTITLSSGELAINNPVTITGPAAKVTVDANKTSRVFNTTGAANGAVITFNGLTITGGSAAGDGGGLAFGEEVITLQNCIVTANSSSQDGGGINVQSLSSSTLASLTLLNTVVSGNTASDDGGAVYFYNGGSFLVDSSTITGNTATTGDGGGFYFFGNVTAGGATVRNSTIAGNVSGSRGGAFVLLGSSSTGTLNIQASTLTGNTATISGGGLYRAANTFVISIESSIISGNVNAAAPDLFSAGTVGQKSSAVGSGIGFSKTDLGGNLPFGTTLRLGALGNYGGVTQTIPLLPGSPAINAGSSTLTIDQRGKSRVGTADMGAFESQGFTINAAGSGQEAIIGTPFPSPLVAIIAPVNSGEPVDGGVITFTPPSDGASAILSGYAVMITSGSAQAAATANTMPGTYEVEASTTNAPLVDFTLTNKTPVETPSFVVNLATDVVDNTDNKTSLREAITFANSQAGADTITFDPAVFTTAQTLVLTGGELGITDALTITGTGAKLLTISGNNASRVFNINIAGVGAAVTVSGVTVTGGSSGNGSAFLVQDDALTLVECAIVGNKAAGGDGGGIHVQGGGSLTIRSSTISGNSSNLGGGIDFYNGGGTLVVENSTLSGNTGHTAGGAIYFRGTVGNGIVIRNSTITANSAGSGGGIFRSSIGTLGITLVSSIVSGNTASSNPDIFNTATTAVDFSAIGSSDGFTLTGANNLPFGANLKLAPLADNGGATPTHALLGGSPAIDAGDNPAPALTFDQRGTGFPRVIGPKADIGAVESFAPVVTGIVVNGDPSPTAQRSRLTQVVVNFATPVDASLFSVSGAVFFTRTGVANNNVESLGTVVDTSSGLIVSPASGQVTSITLTFQNINTAGLDFGSLSDGRWQLSVVPAGYTSPNAPSDIQLRRLFGDNNNDGTINAGDLADFGNVFGTTVANSAFDFNNDGVVQADDFAEFGNRFGVTL